MYKGQPKPRATEGRAFAWGRTRARKTASSFSLIRTVTVGSGVAPDLLTLRLGPEALAGFGVSAPSPPVGNFTPP